MGLVNKCCFFVDLRVGCIVMAIVTAILSIIMSVCVTGIPGYIAIPFSFLGSAALIFAAIYAQGTTQIRRVGVIVYLLPTLLRVILSFIGLILIWVVWGTTSHVLSNASSSPYNNNRDNDSAMTIIHVSFALMTVFGLFWIVLDLYFALVTFVFYQSLNEANSNEVTPA